MTKKKEDQLIAAALSTPEGKATWHRALQEAFAKAADKMPEDSLSRVIAREYAGIAKPDEMEKWKAKTLQKYTDRRKEAIEKAIAKLN